MEENEKYLKELEIFKKEVNKVTIGERSMDYIKLNMGFFDDIFPDAVGCFYKNNNWHVYSIDDRKNAYISGPLNLNNAITYFISELPISLEKRNRYNYDNNFSLEIYTNLKEATGEKVR